MKGEMDRTVRLRQGRVKESASHSSRADIYEWASCKPCIACIYARKEEYENQDDSTSFFFSLVCTFSVSSSSLFAFRIRLHLIRPLLSCACFVSSALMARTLPPTRRQDT